MTALNSSVATLSTLANRDLSALWREVSTAVQAREALRDVLPALVDTYGAASATLAAEWYDDLRDKSGVKGSFTGIPAEIDDMGTDALAGWGVNPLFKEEPDWDAARTLIEGGLQRRIANAARLTVTGSSIADPQAAGWQRVGTGRCDFCRMLIGRGAVYSESSVDFKSHDHCGCGASPAWRDVPTIRAAAAPAPAAPVAEAPPSSFTPEWLRDALDPERRRSVSAVRKDLESTAAGRDLAASIKGFTETRGGVANLRKNLAKSMDGTASEAVTARSRAFVDAMNTYPTESVPTLYRGIAVRVEADTNEWWDAFEGQFKPGQKIQLNASSFSSSEKKAAEFSGMIGGTKKANSNYTAVRLVLEDRPHALPVEQLSKFKSEKEWITGGDFEVVDYLPATKDQPYYRVVVRQAETLEIP